MVVVGDCGIQVYGDVTAGVRARCWGGRTRMPHHHVSDTCIHHARDSEAHTRVHARVRACVCVGGFVQVCVCAVAFALVWVRGYVARALEWTERIKSNT